MDDLNVSCTKEDSMQESTQCRKQGGNVGHTPVVTAEQIAFIRESGKAKALSFGSKVDSRNVHQLRWVLSRIVLFVFSLLIHLLDTVSFIPSNSSFHIRESMEKRNAVCLRHTS